MPAAALSLPGLAAQITDTVTRILLQVDEWRESDAMHYLYVFYNRPAGSRRWRPTGLELLPLNLGRFHRLLAERWPSRSLPTYTMQQERLLARLLRQYLFVTIFRACAESLAAMHAAQRNLDEHLDEVTAEFRRARQGAITAELMDIVAGFEASSPDSAPFHD